jgi:3-phenylpropionate/cinnamic acid dioxygenase small subunit
MVSASTSLPLDEASRVILRSALLLDEGRYVEWAELLTDDGRYEVWGLDPETGRRYLWMEHTRASALAYFRDELDQHVRDTARRLHLVSILDAARDGDALVRATSHFVVHRIPEDGRAEIFALGSYDDALVFRDGVWRLLARVVTVQNCPVIGSHVPF